MRRSIATALVEQPQPHTLTRRPFASFDLREAFDNIVNQSLRPITLWLSGLYLLLAVAHRITLPPAAAPIMITTAAGSAALLLALYGMLGSWPSPARWAHTLSAGIAGIVFFNSILHLYLLASPEHTTNLILLVIGAGCIFLSTPWLAAILSITLVGWGTVAWTVSYSSNWSHYGFALLMASIVSVLIHLVRLRTLYQLEWLRQQDQQQKQTLEESTQKLREAKEELELRIAERTAALAKANAELHQELNERRQTELALRESEERYRTLVEQAADGIYIVDPSGYFLDVNTRGCELLGCTRDEVLRLRVTDPLDVEEGATTPLKLPELYAGQTTLTERRLRRKDGTAIPVEISAKLLPDGRVQGVVRDITERKQQEALIRQLNAELEQRVIDRTAQLEAANKDLEAFSYSVSHDLRAPLRAVSGFAEILARRHQASLNEEGRRYIENIVEASARMSRLIDDLLAYSRVGRRAISLRPIPLGEVFRQILRDLAPRMTAAHAHVTLPQTLPVVLGDATLLSQVFINLLDNAILYHKPETSPCITVSCQADNGQILVSVRDEGIGIPLEYQEKIFNMFQRLHNEDAYPGTGIGLAVVKKSIELLGGRVWVQSEVNQGSTFCVTLHATP